MRTLRLARLENTARNILRYRQCTVRHMAVNAVKSCQETQSLVQVRHLEQEVSVERGSPFTA